MIITQPALVYPNPTDVIPIQVTRVELGAWDIQTNIEHFVDTQIPAQFWHSAYILIQNDDGFQYYPVSNGAAGPADWSMIYSVSASGILTLRAGTSSIFRVTSDFNNSISNRGYVNILRRLTL